MYLWCYITTMRVNIMKSKRMIIFSGTIVYINNSRPREEYLKQKIEEMNVSKDISIAVEQGISNTIMDIKQNFITNSEYQGLSVRIQMYI